MIEVNGLYKKYSKKVLAVKDLSFSVKAGEVVGLLGENGAGKTTTLRILATILSPTKGTVVIDGYDIKKDGEKVRGSIGALFGGDVALYDRLTARENIEYFGQLYDMKPQELNNRIVNLAEYFQFEDYLDKKASELSRGMRQKIAIARAIVHDPKIMLLDEPTTGLDVVARRLLYDLISQWSKEGKTILFSSHSISEIERLCQRVIIINKGQLVEEGTDSYLKEKYALDNLEDVFIHLITFQKESLLDL
ncbi:ATP-binding cassette domain-containing protein [Clostridium sp. CF012]|uniref:ABC transporter ATP-binding protein n=1 Tax=Clostridium sp. CF012 TaxID=2843319 RepID=UPI001C0D80A4|nr:ATP-binding cassette domain-containing protein [Clostridium sp. CF012]MBU3143313.1 ATP-binding cassette domain-containing protein [Clostridium sp. CF012]